MSVIGEFTIDEFWEAEDVYEKMLERMKERAKEIAIEFGKADSGWIAKDFNLVCVDENAEVMVEAILVKRMTDIEKARGIKEENVVFKFPMDWLFFDDYEEELEREKMDEKILREKEYAEYLKLKEKFEI